MDLEKLTLEKAMELFMRQPRCEQSVPLGRLRFDLFDDNAVGYALDGKLITRFYAAASVKDGRRLSTRTARRKSLRQYPTAGGSVLELGYEENRLRLTLTLTVREGEARFIAAATLRDLKRSVTTTNYIAPLDFAYPVAACEPLFLSLDQRMLLVPYDNDMWVRYECAPLRPGRTSYDLSAIYDPATDRGLLIGALDFDRWKNAVRCSQSDARCYTAFSGVADAGTHDICPHGYLEGEEVSSARFVCGWCEDIRDGLESYGRLAMEGRYTAPWHGPAPFGWNSYSAGCMTLEQWREAGRFLREELPAFCDAGGRSFVNLDANFMLDEKKMRAIVQELHENGQGAGNYTAPLMGLDGLLGKLLPLKGSVGKSFESVLMRDEHGAIYPKIDSGKPVDITHPAAEKNLRAILRGYATMGFDYIKIDFLSHGAVEGPRHDPAVRTGRQALSRFYRIVAEELDPARIGREVFVDLSIAPLFPAGYAQGRRCCCDSFGHAEDVRYILNALTYGWWVSGTLYRFSDPDHTVLYRSKIDGRGVTDPRAALSRYHASLISGTVMLLSDDFGPYGDEAELAACRERVKSIANNERLNAVGRLGRAFRPVSLTGDAASAYYLYHEGRRYVALFNLEDRAAEVSVLPEQVGAPPAGRWIDLDDGAQGEYSGSISAALEPCASVIYELC